MPEQPLELEHRPPQGGGVDRRVGGRVNLGHRHVGLLVHDSLPTEEIQRIEYGVALRHAADPLVIIDSYAGQIPVLSELCEEGDRGEVSRVRCRSHRRLGRR